METLRLFAQELHWLKFAKPPKPLWYYVWMTVERSIVAGALLTLGSGFLGWIAFDAQMIRAAGWALIAIGGFNALGAIITALCIPGRMMGLDQ